MSIHRKAARRDKNESDIIAGLARLNGVTIRQISGAGVPDLLIGYRGQNFLLEVKTETGKLTPAQIDFFDTWNGQKAVVRTLEDAKRVIGYDESDLENWAVYLPDFDMVYTWLLLGYPDYTKLLEWVCSSSTTPPKPPSVNAKYAEIPAYLGRNDPAHFWKDYRAWLRKRPGGALSLGEYDSPRVWGAIAEYRKTKELVKATANRLKRAKDNLYKEWFYLSGGL